MGLNFHTNFLRFIGDGDVEESGAGGGGQRGGQGRYHVRWLQTFMDIPEISDHHNSRH